MEYYSQRKTIKIDPRTLFLVNIMFCLVVLMVANRNASHICFAIALMLMLFSRLNKEVIRYATAYIAIALTEYLVIAYNISVLMVVTSISAYLFCKVIPMLMITTIIIKRVKINEIITALEKMKLPRGIVLGIVVSFRFVPTMKYEFKLIRESMRMRGIDITPLKMILTPIKAIELFLVPLLFRCLKIAEELTATALTRGVENEGLRTSYFEVELSTNDWIIIIGVLAILSMTFYAVI